MSTPDWRRSSFCGGSGCVEVGATGNTVLMRNSKNPTGPILVYAMDEWMDFVAGVKAGEFDCGESDPK